MFPIHLIVPSVFLCVASVLAVGASRAGRGNAVSQRIYLRTAVIFFAVALALLVRYGIK
jgi:hypothetical protein